MTGLCACGHPREAHLHYRPGRDCSLCPDGACRRFHRTGPIAGLTRLAGLGRLTRWAARRRPRR